MKCLRSPGCWQRVGTCQSQRHLHLQQQLVHCQPSLRLHRAKQRLCRDASQLYSASASSEQPEQQQADALQSSIHCVTQLGDSPQQQRQQSHQHLQQNDPLLLEQQHHEDQFPVQQGSQAVEEDMQQQQQERQQQRQQEQQQDVLQHTAADPSASQQRHWQMLQRMVAFMVSYCLCGSARAALHSSARTCMLARPYPTNCVRQEV